MATKTGKNVSLVLSSGGSKGLAQIGVINVLEKQGFNITSVSGSSIGSIIGGLYAMGQLQKYAQWVKTLNKREVWGLLDFTLTSQGLLKGETVFNKMKTFIPDMNIEDMNIPFAAVATDIINEKEVVFDRGSFYEAARASMAIPALFTPVKYKDTILVDGGVLSPLPIKYVKRNQGDILVVINLYGEKNHNDFTKNENRSLNSFVASLSSLIKTGDKTNIGYFSLLTHTSAAMIHKIARLNIEKYNPDIVINIPADAANTFDFFKAKELIELGEKAAEKALDSYFKTGWGRGLQNSVPAKA